MTVAAVSKIEIKYRMRSCSFSGVIGYRVLLVGYFGCRIFGTSAMIFSIAASLNSPLRNA